SAATVSSVHSAAPLAPTSVSDPFGRSWGGKEMDEALDLLSDSLGEREPDPDENKPVVDKVKEKAKSEHRDKLGERDDTIPPDYQKLLESGEQLCIFLHAFNSKNKPIRWVFFLFLIGQLEQISQFEAASSSQRPGGLGIWIPVTTEPGSVV
uniref:Calpastatin n=1 Tax=Strix occidentalis caurina TaxID=311401 RepID=A0A8D0EXG7_STROC